MTAQSTQPLPALVVGRLTAHEFHRARGKALLVARQRARSSSTAEELVDDVIAAAFDPQGSPWAPESEPDLARYLVRAVLNKWPAQRRKQKRRDDPGWLAKAADEAPPVRDPSQHYDDAEEEALAARLLDHAGAALTAAGHERPAQVLALWRGGNDDAAEQARRLGCSRGEVHRAREVVRRYIQKEKPEQP